MGGRGAYAVRRRGVVLKESIKRSESSTGGGGENVVLSEAVGSADFPQIANFTNKNIVDFNYKLKKGEGTITIKDDRGRTYKGVYEGHGASRDTFGFKEGFVIKFDGLKSGGFAAGFQTRREVEAYKNLNTALARPAGKTPRGGVRAAKARVPNLISAYLNQTIKLPDGTTRRNVAIAMFTKAKGGHDTGVKAGTKKGENLKKRVRQYIRGLAKRGVNTSDFQVFERNGNIRLHNIYRDKRTGKLTIVDLGI